ncbi:MAG: hypothetical protein KatS3mg010_1151 [Acidimicrobiia bacterium]|nr:MAG: hypothetical protein KatS3mg010_1151 [Acidimicrobiia bacterium]
MVRRVTGRSIGTYFRDEIAAPLGLDFWIGLPEEHEHRVARLVGSIGERAQAADDETRARIAELMGPDTMLGKALSAPGGALSGPDVWNARAVHAAEIPAAGGIGDARSIARLYAACIGEVDGIRVLGPETVARAARAPDRGAQRGDPRPRPPVRPRVHRAVEHGLARWAALVRALRARRLGGLGRSRRPNSRSAT